MDSGEAGEQAGTRVALTRLGFSSAALLVLGIGILFAPWLWFKHAGSIFKVLGGLLGPVTGIMLVDFYLVRRQSLAVDELYSYRGRYQAWDGWNPAGLAAFVLGGTAALTGSVVPGLAILGAFSWFIGLGIGALVYAVFGPRGGAAMAAPAFGTVS